MTTDGSDSFEASKSAQICASSRCRGNISGAIIDAFDFPLRRMRQHQIDNLPVERLFVTLCPFVHDLRKCDSKAVGHMTAMVPSSVQQVPNRIFAHRPVRVSPLEKTRSAPPFKGQIARSTATAWSESGTRWSPPNSSLRSGRHSCALPGCAKGVAGHQGPRTPPNGRREAHLA